LQTISDLSAIPSQWALQYFDLSVEMQLQAAFAHFLGAVVAIPLSSGTRFVVHGKYDAQIMSEDQLKSELFLAQASWFSLDFSNNFALHSLNPPVSPAHGGE
jgi:hypothetical protein